MAKALPGTALPMGAEGSTEAEGKLDQLNGCRNERRNSGQLWASAWDVGEPPHCPHCSWATDKTPANLALQAVCSWIPSKIAREHTWPTKPTPGHGAGEFLFLTCFP